MFFVLSVKTKRFFYFWFGKYIIYSYKYNKSKIHISYYCFFVIFLILIGGLWEYHQAFIK